MEINQLRIINIKPGTSFPSELSIGHAKYKNQDVFVKILQGSKNRYFVNEVNIYKFLNSLSEDKIINIPEFIRSKIGNDQSLLVNEFIPGENIESFSSDEKIRIIHDVLNYLQNIKVDTENIKKFEIKSRKPIFYILTAPLLIFKASLNYPTKIFLILKSSMLFFRHSLNVLHSKLVFAHRDIDTDNIIVFRNKLHLIDFQYSLITCFEYDYASILRSLIEDNKLTTMYINQIVRKDLLIESSFNSFKALSIYYTLMGLTDKKFPKNRTLAFFKVLNLMSNLKYE